MRYRKAAWKGRRKDLYMRPRESERHTLLHLIRQNMNGCYSLHTGKKSLSRRRFLSKMCGTQRIMDFLTEKKKIRINPLSSHRWRHSEDRNI